MPVSSGKSRVHAGQLRPDGGHVAPLFEEREAGEVQALVLGHRREAGIDAGERAVRRPWPPAGRRRAPGAPARCRGRRRAPPRRAPPPPAGRGPRGSRRSPSARGRWGGRGRARRRGRRGCGRSRSPGSRGRARRARGGPRRGPGSSSTRRRYWAIASRVSPAFAQDRRIAQPRRARARCRGGRRCGTRPRPAPRRLRRGRRARAGNGPPPARRRCRRRRARRREARGRGRGQGAWELRTGRAPAAQPRCRAAPPATVSPIRG